MTTVSEIIRCTLQDLGSRKAAIRYCQRIARAGGSFAAQYAEAADYLSRTQASYYVLNEHTLGYVLPPQPNVFGVLSADIHGHNPMSGVVVVTLTDTLRVATLEDFQRFRVGGLWILLFRHG